MRSPLLQALLIDADLPLSIRKQAERALSHQDDALSSIVPFIRQHHFAIANDIQLSLKEKNHDTQAKR